MTTDAQNDWSVIFWCGLAKGQLVPKIMIMLGKISQSFNLKLMMVIKCSFLGELSLKLHSSYEGILP